MYINCSYQQVEGMLVWYEDTGQVHFLYMIVRFQQLSHAGRRLFII